MHGPNPGRKQPFSPRTTASEGQKPALPGRHPLFAVLPDKYRGYPVHSDNDVHPPGKEARLFSSGCITWRRQTLHPPDKQMAVLSGLPEEPPLPHSKFQTGSPDPFPADTRFEMPHSAATEEAL